MSAITMDISDFTVKIKELITGLKHDEEIIVTSGNLPVARLIAINSQTSEQQETIPKRRKAGLTEGIAWISPDFDEPLEDFKEYMP
ncbi:MAG: type II toxin-antitoxin system Phd/YefM family antitoxin [Blastocatellia bacterium]